MTEFRLLQDVYAASPGAPQPLKALVTALVRAQQFDRAVAFLQTVLEKNPTNAEALVLLGSTELQRNAPDKAQKSFATAIERQPKNMIGYQALAEFYLAQKKVDDAQQVIKAALKEAPDNIAMRITMAGALEIKGDYEAAIREYEAVLKEQSGSMIAANNLANLLSEHRTDPASLDRAYSIAAMLRKSQVPQFKDTLGWIYYRKGEHKAAIVLLEEAVAALPNFPQIRYHLGMSYIATGETAKASEQLKKALEQASADEQIGNKVREALKKLGS